MQFKSLALFVGLALTMAAAAVMAAPSTASSEIELCGTHETAPASVEQTLASKIDAAQVAGTSDSTSDAASPNSISASIPVYYHLITDGTGNGIIPSRAINDQISILNDNYAGTGMRFFLAGIDTTVNSDWFNIVRQSTPQERAMKSALRRGEAQALNVYTVGLLSTGVLGYAVFPWDFASNPSNDGIVLDWNTYPGGPIAAYPFGKTLVHEVGHWAGLYHVFQGGCFGDGDFVADTPPQATLTRGCPEGKDTCVGGGVDSIHSHMDYSSEPCRNMFTNGQVARMGAALSIYRGF